jgi:hypothetical protein
MVGSRLNRLAEADPDAAPVEEHLLVCEEYGGRLAGWDAYLRATRAATRRQAVMPIIQPILSRLHGGSRSARRAPWSARSEGA